MFYTYGDKLIPEEARGNLNLEKWPLLFINLGS